MNNNEYILGIIPETITKPFHNQPLFIYIGNFETNKFRIVTLQPNEYNKDIELLFKPLELLHNEMKKLVTKYDLTDNIDIIFTKE